MSQGGAVVLEKLVPELGLAGSVMNEAPAGEDGQAEQLLFDILHALPAAHHRHKVIEGVEVTEIHIPLPQFVPVGQMGQAEVEKQGDHQILQKVVPLGELFLPRHPILQLSAHIRPARDTGLCGGA